MSIKQKLTWAFVAIACLPVIIVATIVIINLRTQVRATFFDSSSREIRQIENGMNLFFEGIGQSVEYLAKRPQVAQARDLKDYSSADAALVPLPEESKVLLQYFEQYASAFSAATVAVGFEDRTFVNWPNPAALASYDPQVRPWYKAAMATPGKVARTPAYYWEDTGELLISNAMTVARSPGHPAGVVALDVSIKRLTNIVRQIKMGESGYLMLVERDGTVLVDPSDPTHNFKKLADLGQGYRMLAQARGLSEVTINGVRYLANA
ncbi:cache domain-containing protein [Pseudomonas sp. SGAir0191]|uniref:cache domain-containing protein n=1 Tax=Pseudomonas TaxID=286 RepID=UPI0026B01FAC